MAGGIYDDRFLIRPTAAASAIMPEAAKEFPYEGGSEMLLVSEVDNRAFLKDLFEKMYDELPVPKKKKKKAG